MNYKKQYDLLIIKRKVRPLFKAECYCERHHIVPKALGGENASANLINLTAREHFIAHRLLEKMTFEEYGETSREHQAMAQALWFMMHKSSRSSAKVTSGSYAAIRKTYSKSISGPNNRQYMKRGKLSKLFGRKHKYSSNTSNRKSHLGRIHMHDPATDKGALVRNEDVNLFLKSGYVLGMSEHERKAIARRNIGQSHMFDPVTDNQVYAQPKDVKKYLKLGYIFGRCNKACQKHNEKLRGRIAFYHKDTGRKFYVLPDNVKDVIQQGHILSKRAMRILNESKQ